MSFQLTDLHMLIVRAHDRHKIPIGKMMRVALHAAVNGKFSLYKPDGSRGELNVTDRDLLSDLAAKAERQTEVQWWTKGHWALLLKAVFVNETDFWSWLNEELGTSDPKLGKLDPKLSSAILDLLKREQPGRTIQWDEFCDTVRDNCDGWKEHKNRVPKRGFGDKTIKRFVNVCHHEVKDKKDKEDKEDK